MATQNLATAIDGMRKAAEAFEGTNSGFRAVNANIDGAVAQLGVSWTGEASRKFQDAMAQWDQQFESVIRDLDVLRDNMLASMNQYSTGGASAVDIVGGLNNAVSGGIPGI
ncbi:WXG100 family type VII secretion target [Actinoplanes sp. TRM 88003]|uniref:ESAT-6-like protein n=1 Tax=Paractinoplanes aksuensis TaxID=2939490 RepID=A0ABT1DXJ9_9ACTN|nr:WXG100 family type VII secretion target [Actinoplanes aksuensis]MCO8275490.1 WXG100 family type VII secretion target [Actinoplanes aksuensis]